ncbi:sugar ABC transporter ATP-binding protein [Ensifer adhaerens]|uniref:sugar ABC transporter ATP-binding protein n=2 Tax=Ensifer adhaerens TaxID=106592 RepID=UPI002E285E9F|nr:sugar ABC transporter ATP-binding protein [Ensifer adhaerens]
MLINPGGDRSPDTGAGEDKSWLGPDHHETANPAGAVMALRGVGKSFGRLKVLEGIDLDIYPGEVHVLLGENGAGKSTLIKTLSGIHSPDAGEILLDGAPVKLSGPGQAQRLGIGVIHQELALVPYLSVEENIVLGREPRSLVPCSIDRSAQRNIATRALALVGFQGDPKGKVADLTIAKQQLVEIAKALAHQSRVLIMDEPTASISERDATNLHDIIRDLKRRGTAIVFISHRMREVFDLADRVTVLRDGHKILTTVPSSTTPEALIKAMVGRTVGSFYQRKQRNEPGETILETRSLGSSNGIVDMNILVRSGEVVGLAGLVGSGRTEFARTVFGLDSKRGGEVLLHGRPFKPDPVRAVRSGIAFVPESRKEEGLALSKSVSDNLTLASLWRIFPSGIRSRTKARRIAQKLVDRLRVATRSLSQPVRTLSGGNQQKVVIGKWLPMEGNRRLIIIDEPTRGVDVGAKAEILELVEGLAAEGSGILMISSELPEIVGFCDRVYVLRSGTVRGELSGEELTEESIMKLAVHDGH